ncbi:relaxase/mobilization nuclease domain-containing protein [Pedobacter sp. ISL-68]|uniref:conjugal transfer protein MobB n=1 Tax=unclassified Pedobacter TaxID=2628915 RepID=UPI001BE5DEBF|nr:MULTISPECIES: conjugal transfer protein MobB [unclassified Pedobacter]MBT2559803.1 relaxase/mobilization nuclease domain-containing protein [Pedobacter sp. ISL-64]MBT2592108.1 relaxase/mobilization nuclease domain-containing protein [Pedobacter sp. ISL-68]
MIAKIGKGANLFGALNYNQQKVDKENGQILFIQKIAETLNGQYSVSQLHHSFEFYLSANQKVEKPVLHISLNPDPKDLVSDEAFVSIAQDYMKDMGYGDQPYVVFKHTDTERTHIHIVSTCVKLDGKKISDKFDHPRSMEICRELEKKYNLLTATEQTYSTNEKTFNSVDYKKGDIKSQLAAVVRYLPKHYRFQSIGEYNALLSLFNITAEEVKGELQGKPKQGLVYFAINENGEKVSSPFKASLFGKGAGYFELQNHFEKSSELLKKEKTKHLLIGSIEVAMHTVSDEENFKQQLVGHGINTVVRKNAEGRIYGITFIDHNSKTVWNGSRLGKNLSANVFNQWWNNNQKPQININTNEKTISPLPSPELPIDEKLHNIFDFLDKEEPGFTEGLGGLLPQAQGDNFEEQLFENQIKRRKRKTGK